MAASPDFNVSQNQTQVSGGNPVNNSSSAYQSYNTLQGLIGPSVAATQAGYQQQLDALRTQQANTANNQQFQGGVINQNLANTLANYGLTQQQYGVQGQQLDLSKQATQQNYDLGLQGLNLQEGYAGQQYGLQNQGRALESQYAGQQYGNQQQGFGLQQGQLNLQGQSLADQLAQAQYNAQYQTGQADISANAAGIYNTSTRTGRDANIAQQLAFQTQANNISQQGLGISNQQLGLQETGAAQAFDYGNQQRGLAQQSADQSYGYQQGQFGIQGQQIANSYNNSNAQNALSRQQLGIQQQGLGMSETQARQSAQNALAQLGIQGQLSNDQINQAIGALNQGQVTNLTGFLPQLMQLLGGNV